MRPWYTYYFRWLTVSVIAKKLYHPVSFLWPSLPSALYFNVNLWWKLEVSKDIAMGANLTGSVPSKLVSSNLKLLQRTSYLLFHACQSETEMERFQSPTKLQVPRGEQKKTGKVNQRLGINVQWKSLAVLVTYIFVNISHLSSCFRWFHFLQLRSIVMQLGSIFSCLPQKP